MTAALGLTLPFESSLRDHLPLLERLWDCGYSQMWTGEAAGADGFSPLVLAAARLPDVRVGTSVVPVFTRGPALLAMHAASLADVAPGRAVVGIGASTAVIVESWNAVPFRRPLARVRQTVAFLRRALRGERIDEDFGEFEVRRFRLGRVPEIPPLIHVAALRPAMLRLAGEVADGVILNWIAPSDVPVVTAATRAAGDRSASLEAIARIFVCPTDDPEQARAAARPLIAEYLSVPAYAELHRWLGRAGQLAATWQKWDAGDRAGAAAAVPDEVVDALIVHGPPARCATRIADYVAAGITTPVVRILPLPAAYRTADAAIAVAQAYRSVAPAGATVERR